MASTQETASFERSVTKYWVRLSEKDRWPFVPWGLIPLVAMIALALFAFTRFASRDIEANVAQSVKASLQDKGLSFAKVSVSGQQVMLTGVQPTDAAGEAAVASAKAALCDTWGGMKTCAISVDAKWDKAPPLPTPTLDVELTRQGQALTLTGEVSSPTVREQLVAAARERFPAATLDDQLRVRAGVGPSAVEPAALARVVGALGACKQGLSRFASGSYSLRCELSAADTVATRAVASGPGLSLGNIELIVSEEADACEKTLAELLGKTKLEFDTGKAKLRATSGPVLKAVADAAAKCPGRLTVEGHTDNVGDAQGNQMLSQARAEAVVTALGGLGIDATRLGAAGFGANRPIADNGTADGRSRNRRIEIHVVRN
jgi:OmpA-OmpF porin, OOP family